jgi:hypothetical protein
MLIDRSAREAPVAHTGTTNRPRAVICHRRTTRWRWRDGGSKSANVIRPAPTPDRSYDRRAAFPQSQLGTGSAGGTGASAGYIRIDLLGPVFPLVLTPHFIHVLQIYTLINYYRNNII